MPRHPRALVGALLLVAAAAAPSARAAKPAPPNPRMAKAQLLAREFHTRVRFLFQQRSEEDRQAIDQLIRSGGLGPVVQAWGETRIGLLGEPPEAAHPEVTVAEAQEIARRFIRRKIQGHRWDPGRVTRKGDDWKIPFSAQGFAGVRGTVLVDASTGVPRMRD